MPEQRLWRTWVLFPLCCLAAAACLLPVDIPVAWFCRHGGSPRVIGDILQNAEAFGHAAGVVLISVTVWALDPRGRWLSWALTGSALSGGIAANVGKLLIARTRPRSFDLWHGTCADTFGEWLPFLSRGATNQSFPSAHTATAVGLAVMLCVAYPRGRWWFVTLAVLVGLHRIEAGAHYPSDVLVGAALGWLAGHGVLRSIRSRFQPAEAAETFPLRRAA